MTTLTNAVCGLCSRRFPVAEGACSRCTALLRALSAGDLEQLVQERDRFRVALEKINVIRNSIVAKQGFNFSEHAYPLVAALNDAGIEGQPYPEALEYFGTMLERMNKAEAENTRLKERLKQAEDLLREAEDWVFNDPCRNRVHTFLKAPK